LPELPLERMAQWYGEAFIQLKLAELEIARLIAKLKAAGIPLDDEAEEEEEM